MSARSGVNLRSLSSLGVTEQEVEEIIRKEEVIERQYRIFATQRNTPNIIVIGDPLKFFGIIWTLCGMDMRNAILMLNASDERRIDIIENKIRIFADQEVMLPGGCHKIVLLYEADSMTEGSQHIFLRIMEIYSGNVRFAFFSKSSEKIIERIKSSCAMIRTQNLTDAQAFAFAIYKHQKSTASN